MFAGGTRRQRQRQNHVLHVCKSVNCNVSGGCSRFNQPRGHAASPVGLVHAKSPNAVHSKLRITLFAARSQYGTPDASHNIIMQAKIRYICIRKIELLSKSVKEQWIVSIWVRNA